ncbi:hypothetical protein GCM10007094_13050 [Pseudovibrio japonicus]|uniref:MobA/VirD2-like nuclease domain-containing protein n=1 Tax=Pseudovibrio japonicus TaxID=366534 RepID=A0ABQ3E647_9HYPH|nr:relaxase/mobilization nuclease domain-containing protein [Pseudovibrio japonicus]GHB26257.1 hypothetical protein GCM10007094_13050 [Pseudovibrio japonicus]
MLIKLFKNGQGGGAAPVDYLVADKVLAYDENRNLLRNASGAPLLKERDPLPEVLAGNPEHTKLLIDSSRHKWSYRAGVMSFDTTDSPSEEQQQKVMEAFERLAFAGLERDQFDVLWVRHTHEDRVELHFCTPRLELSTGNSLNIAPPGYIKAMDVLRDMLNKEHGWADPQDPSRARETKLTTERKDRASSREEIQHWLEELIVVGCIKNRPEMIENLQDARQNQAVLMASALVSFESDIRAILNDAQHTIRRDLAAQHRSISNEIEQELKDLRARLKLHHHLRRWSPLLLLLAVVVSLFLTLSLTWLWATQYQQWQLSNKLESMFQENSSGYLLLNLKTGTLARCELTPDHITCKDILR